MNKVDFSKYKLSQPVGEGIFAFDKPKGFSSNQLLMFIKKETGIKKIGHAGTLDPLATGVLVVAIGKKNTKQLSKFVAKEKEYRAIIRLGSTSETDDAEGPVVEQEIKKIPEIQAINNTVKEFIGEIEQFPPIYSAVKIAGEEAYKRARRGEKVEIKARMVLVKNIIIENYQWPNLLLNITTGPGVYIRSIARDLGQKLGVGGYITDLSRLRVGEFRIEDAIQLNKVE